ncbi:MAG: helix-turn-helix domain-containing protein [Granulosicoccus sp.]
MKQTQHLIGVIKQELKTRQISYRDLACLLELSESAVKQMFANSNFSLKRLDRLCEILEMDFLELAQKASVQNTAIEELTIEQEERLISDPVLLLVSYCVVNQWAFDDIIKRYDISESMCIQKLAELDRMRLAELLPGNRIRPLISLNFRWQPNGPIEQFFSREVQGQFFDSNFNDSDALRLVKSGDISASTFEQLSHRLHSVGQLFDDLAREDHIFPGDQRRGASMILAIRHWQFAAFSELER